MQPLKARAADTGSAWQCDDQYGVHYRMPLEVYRGPDFSRKAFVFPGQSAAEPGMGKADLQHFELLQKRFKIADQLAEARGIPAPSLFIEDPAAIPESALPLVRSLALYTMSIGLFEVLVANNERPALVTGHSFGEFAALAASGIAGFEDVFDLVCERDRACPPAKQAGCMIAVGAGAEETKRALGKLEAFIANLNGPRQTALSLAPGTVKEALASLRRAKLAAAVLDNVAQSYHSPFLSAAAAQLAEYMRTRRFIFNTPRIPMLSSVTRQILTPENFTAAGIEDIIARQLVEPTDFGGQVRAAAEAGCRHFIELAHVKACTPWIKDILQGEDFKVSVPPALAAEPGGLARAPGRSYDSKLVGFLNRIIASVTGYSIEEISLANNFQEDLNIDSIKKVQIIFDFLESQGDFSIDVQDSSVVRQIRTVEDVLAWYMKDKSGAPAAKTEKVSFACYRPEWAAAPSSALEESLATVPPACAWISLGEPGQLAQAASGAQALVFYDDGRPFDFESFAAAISANYKSLKERPPQCGLAMVTQSSSPPEVRGLDGFLRSLAQETACVFRLFEFDAFDSRGRELTEREMARPIARSLRLSGPQRLGRRLVPSAPEKPLPAPATVAAIGGASGITREILKDLIARGAKHIYILGRSPAADVEKNLEELRAKGAAVFYQSGDAAEKAALEAFLARPLAEQGAIDLLIHGGGREFSALADQQTPQNVRAQCGIKIDAVRHLIELCRGRPVKDVVCFSSIAAEFGNAGQTVYAYANMVMSYLCESAAREDLPFRVMAWPAWNKIGMTANENIYRQIALSGQHFLDAETGCRLFRETGKQAGPRVICGEPRLVPAAAGDLLPEALGRVFPGAALQLASPLRLRHWTLADFPDFRDHVVLGNLVVPAALCFSTLFYFGLLETKAVCKLAEVKMLSFMPMHPKDSPYFLDYRRGEKGLHAEIRSNEKHAEAMLVPCRPEDISREPLAVPAETVPMTVTQDYEDCRLSFHFNHNMRVAAPGVVYADLDLKRQKTRLAADPVHRLTAVIEAMLQMGGMSVRTLSEFNSVPLVIKDFVLNSAARMTDTYTIVARSKLVSENAASNELLAYNADGDIFLHVKDERVRMWGSHEA